MLLNESVAEMEKPTEKSVKKAWPIWLFLGCFTFNFISLSFRKDNYGGLPLLGGFGFEGFTWSFWPLIFLGIVFVAKILDKIINKKSSPFWPTLTAIILFLTWLLLSVKYVPHEQGSFIKKIQDGFASGVNRIALKEVTPFEWDEVCVLEKYPDTSVPPLLTNDFFKEKGYLNEEGILEITFNKIKVTNELEYMTAFVFIKNNTVKKVYRFITPKIKIKGADYLIGATEGTPKKNEAQCVSQETAYLKESIGKKNNKIFLVAEH